MNFREFLDPLTDALGGSLPTILGALALLMVGWLVALVIRVAVRKALGFLGLNRRLDTGSEKKIDFEAMAASGAYWLVLLMALVGFLNVLDLQLVSEPLQAFLGKIFAFAPRILAAGLLALVAWVLAMILRKVVSAALGATKLDERLSLEAGLRPMSDSLGNVIYWLVILLFLPAILGTLGLEGLLGPVQGMVDQILAMLPNILAAAVIGLVGWFVAKLLRNLVSSLLSAGGADRLGQNIGLREGMSLSGLIGLVVYILVLVPAVIAALNALKIDAISRPATDMLAMIMASLPNLIAAALILSLTWFIAKFASGLVASLLEGLGINEIPAALGLGAAFERGPKLSTMMGNLILFFAMLFAVVEAANRLDFLQVSTLVAQFIEFGGQVLMGVVIIAVGLWLAGLAHGAISRLGGSNAGAFAGLARIAILGVVFAMGLRAMGIADEIVQLAFGLALGSVAVAVALSFGLGGREAAGKQMEHWLGKLRGER